MINILYTSNWLRDLYDEELKAFNLKPQHFNLLRILQGRFPGYISPSEIKEVMLDKGPDVTRLIDKLVKMGLTDRCQNKENRRVMEIRISDKGQTVLSTINSKIEKIEKQFFVLNDEDAEQLSDLLDKARQG